MAPGFFNKSLSFSQVRLLSNNKKTHYLRRFTYRIKFFELIIKPYSTKTAISIESTVTQMAEKSQILRNSRNKRFFSHERVLQHFLFETLRKTKSSESITQGHLPKAKCVFGSALRHICKDLALPCGC